MNRTQSKAIDRISRSLFAEHLYDGLTRKKNYGLVEATRHWNIAKGSPSDYHFIEFPNGTDSNNLIEYLDKHDENVALLEEYLRENGTLNLTGEELDALADLRGEK